ncbi:MAG: hypothetical protein NT066_07075, partial [Candidatus Omnitrophica bacterium]|nr:hypothetical protein [Candidatus Omnitrophota bacterium]
IGVAFGASVLGTFEVVLTREFMFYETDDGNNFADLLWDGFQGEKTIHAPKYDTTKGTGVYYDDRGNLVGVKFPVIELDKSSSSIKPKVNIIGEEPAYYLPARGTTGGEQPKKFIPPIYKPTLAQPELIEQPEIKPQAVVVSEMQQPKFLNTPLPLPPASAQATAEALPQPEIAPSGIEMPEINLSETPRILTGMYPTPSAKHLTTPSELLIELNNQFHNIQGASVRKIETMSLELNPETNFGGRGDAQVRIPDIYLGKPEALFNRNEQGDLIGVPNPESYELIVNPFKRRLRIVDWVMNMPLFRNLERSFNREEAINQFFSVSPNGDARDRQVLATVERERAKGNVEAKRFFDYDLPKLALGGSDFALEYLAEHFERLPMSKQEYILGELLRRAGEAGSSVAKGLHMEITAMEIMQGNGMRDMVEKASEDFSIPEDQRALAAGILEGEIFYPSRYGKEWPWPGVQERNSYLPEIFKNYARVFDKRFNNDQDDRPLAFIATASEDWNGAFNALGPGIEEVFKKMKVVAVEYVDVRDIVSLLGKFTQLDKKPELIIFRGHGTGYGEGRGIRFGPDKFGVLGMPEEKRVIEGSPPDFVEMFRAAGLENSIAKGAAIILKSCSTGSALRDGKPNVAQQIFEGFGGKAYVFAPESEPNRLTPIFSDKGELSNAYYYNSETRHVVITHKLSPWPVIEPPDIVESPATGIAGILRLANINAPSAILGQRAAALTYTSNFNNSNRNSSLPSIKQSGVGGGLGN